MEGELLLPLSAHSPSDDSSACYEQRDHFVGTQGQKWERRAYAVEKHWIAGDADCHGHDPAL